MKKIRLLAVVLMLFMGTAVIQKDAKAQVNVNFQLFYDNLDPYGDWISYPDYGYVWIPRAERSFIPYRTNGHWVNTYDGWTWVSDYQWGWAPFHYGRWFYDNYYGWLWVPDDVWAPAWVSWRSSYDYYGWAPLAPGVNIVVDLPFGMGYDMPSNYWTFVPNTYFGRPDIYNYYVDNSTVVNIYNKTRVVNNMKVNNGNNVRYNAGPSLSDVEKRSGRKFNTVAIKETGTPGHKLEGNNLQLYRPRMQKNAGADQPAPRVIKEKATRNRNQADPRPGKQLREQQADQRHMQQEKPQRQQQGREQQRAQQQKDQQQQREQQRVQQQQKDQQRMQQQQREQQRVQQQQRDQQRMQQQQREQQRVQQQQRDQQRMQQQQREQQRMQQQQQRIKQPQQQRQQPQQGPPQQGNRPGKKGNG